MCKRGRPKRPAASDFLELKFRGLWATWYGCQNQTWVLHDSNVFSKQWSRLSSPLIFFLIKWLPFDFFFLITQHSLKQTESFLVLWFFIHPLSYCYWVPIIHTSYVCSSMFKRTHTRKKEKLCPLKHPCSRMRHTADAVNTWTEWILRVPERNETEKAGPGKAVDRRQSEVGGTKQNTHTLGLPHSGYSRITEDPQVLRHLDILISRDLN